MIYTIRHNGSTIATSAGNSVQAIFGGRLALSANTAGKLVFAFPCGHLSYDVLRPLGGIISVERDGEEIFFGRVLSITEDINRTRMYTCEGAFAFLSDAEAKGLAEYITLAQLAAYASEHTSYQWASDSDISLYVGKDEEPTEETTEELEIRTCKDVLAGYISSHGGYFTAYRDGDGIIHLAYSEDARTIAAQEIRDGYNLTNISVETDATDIITRIIGVSKSKASLTATYEANIHLYGVHEKRKTYDIGTYDKLMEHVRADVEAKCTPTRTVSASAIDVDGTSFRLLDSAHTIARKHGVDEWLTVTGLSIDLSGMSPTAVTLGKRKVRLTETMR